MVTVAVFCGLTTFVVWLLRTGDGTTMVPYIKQGGHETR